MKIIAILVSKLLSVVGKLIGKGTSLPGKIALKLCPSILSQLQLPKYVIAVTGSNGKTSTVEMIAAILRAGGKTVVYNEEGSNQVEGVSSAVISFVTQKMKVTFAEGADPAAVMPQVLKACRKVERDVEIAF